MYRAGPDAARAIGKPLPALVEVVGEYKGLVEQGLAPPTYSADIMNLCISLSAAISKYSTTGHAGEESPGDTADLQTRVATAAEWLVSAAGVLLQSSHARASTAQDVSGCLPMPDLCAFAFSLHDLGEVLHSKSRVIQLAEEIAEHASCQMHLGSAPPSVQAWKDLLYGLTKAGLVVGADIHANPEAVTQHSLQLQLLLDKGVQQLPGLLISREQLRVLVIFQVPICSHCCSR
jgi:hypothetical protein